LIEINLLPPEHRRKERMKLALPSDLPAGKIVLMALGGILAIQLVVSVFAFVQAGRLTRITREIEQLKTENKEITLQKAEIAAMKARAREVDSLSERKFYWSGLLNAVSDSISKGIWLSELYMAEGAAPDAVGAATEGGDQSQVRYLRISGSAVGQGDETASIGKFITELKQNALLGELFDDVRLSNINQKKIQDFDVYDFLLVCVFKKGKV
jgi:Tfp pilus assembly protein PilN